MADALAPSVMAYNTVPSRNKSVNGGMIAQAVAKKKAKPATKGKKRG